MIENIPIVIPNRERNVLNLLTTTELSAKRILSLNNLRNLLIQTDIWSIKYTNNELLFNNAEIPSVYYHYIMPILLRLIKNYLFLFALKTRVW